MDSAIQAEVDKAKPGAKVIVEYVFNDASSGTQEVRYIAGTLESKESSMLTVVNDADEYDHRTILVRKITGFTSDAVKSDDMRVVIKTLTGKSIFLPYSPSESIAKIKAELEDMVVSPPGQLRLVFAGKQLEDRFVLADYGIEKGATIYLLVDTHGMK
jgi:Ubiquitin family